MRVRSWDRILACVGGSLYPEFGGAEKQARMNEESPDEKRVGASFAFTPPRPKLGKLFPVVEKRWVASKRQTPPEGKSGGVSD